MQKLKAAETNDPKAKIEVWDWRYYQNQLNKQKYNVDKEALRNFFPFQKVLDGMFAIYQNIFGLKFEKITAPYKWVDDLQLYMVSDSSSGRATGNVLSRHVSARRKIQSLRRSSRSSTANCCLTGNTSARQSRYSATSRHRAPISRR